ncbi:M16 family metallopeptidase [Hydrogenophaga sp. PBL-H3]|uniref:M16 family metallopeptidase n=1 Tax=Hydrogenophaga sp. PBL-H3 TaxID=434010 RepID=UPI0013201BB9|nr:pitrilysin family protein [Hydrogenophaga sp. PBL-H3]QHE75463.1 insulinase family protein [Hydrogenophaga sp. PBL-H3]QHE79889.1 insulinase family protein [Hydrogenophaga sp. PBL-H3]
MRVFLKPSIRCVAVSAVLLAGLSGAAQAAIPIEHWIHASGARVYLVSSPSIPMLDVQLDFDGGSRRDPPAQAGLAGATAGLLSDGVAAQPGLPALDENQLSEAWVDLGAQFGAQASADRFTLSLRTLTEPDLLQRAVALAARQIGAPAWPQAVWQRDRERLLASLKEAENRPGTQAGRAFARAVYGTHPYGFQPDAATFNAINVVDMQAFYRRHVVACRAQVTLVGAIDRAQADAMVGQFMAPLTSRGCEPLPAVAPVQPLERAIDERLPFAAAQAQVSIGQPGIARNDPDFFPLFVGNYILGGGGFVSRLTTEVREKRGLSYSVSSYFAPGRHAGAFQIGLTTRPDQAAQAVEVSRNVVKQFVEQGPTEDELKAAKAFLVNGFSLRIDSNRKLLDNVANIGWSGLPLDYLDTWTQQIERVSVADIRRSFARVLQPDRMVTVVVGAQP